MATKKATKASSAAKFITEMNERAEKLAAVRAQIREREEEWKKRTDALFDEEKALKEQLLLDLSTVGLTSVKVSNGDAYYVSKSYSYEVKNPLALDSWARENGCVRIDQTILKQRLNRLRAKEELPDFVSPVERNTISVRKAKDEHEQSDD